MIFSDISDISDKLKNNCHSVQITLGMIYVPPQKQVN